MAEILHKELSYAVVGAAIEVHRLLGSGFLKAIYQAALAHELTLRAIPHETQRLIPIAYKDLVIGDYRADFVVADRIVLELKAVAKLQPAHLAQALNYLAGTGLRLAILINFGAAKLEIQRVVK